MINVTPLRSAYLLICQGRWLPISALWLGLVCGSANADDAVLVDLAAAVPTIVVEARYAGSHNFVGVPIEGYLDARVLLTQPAVEALGAVQRRLLEDVICQPERVTAVFAILEEELQIFKELQ